MTLRCARLLLLVWSFAVIGATSAWADPAPPGTPSQIVDPATPEGVSIVEPAVDTLSATLGKPVRLAVRRLNVADDWAFVYASMTDPGGEPFDYTGTAYDEADAHHTKSRTYAGLLRRNGNTWAIVDQAIGPSDLAWGGWPQQYGVPWELINV